MFNFKDIDKYYPLYYEKQGMLKNKLWFENREKIDFKTGRFERGLFKPKRKVWGEPETVFCGNHYGEFIGWKLAEMIGMHACRVELASVYTRKNQYAKGNIVLKKGCISYSELKITETLVSGSIIIEQFKGSKEYKKLVEHMKPQETQVENNNIEIILASIEHVMLVSGATEQEIRKAKRYIIQMVVFDCAFGNNDRHDENWSMARDKVDGKMRVYPAYDNEKVLGLYEDINCIQSSINSDDIVKSSDDIFISKIGTPINPSNVHYEELIRYLSEEYPEETLSVLESITSNVTAKRIKNILEECEGLPIEYVHFAETMFDARRQILEKYINRIKYREEDTRI